MTVITRTVVSWDAMPCSLVAKYNIWKEHASSNFRVEIPSILNTEAAGSYKTWYLHTELRDVTSQKKTIFIYTVNSQDNATARLSYQVPPSHTE